MESLSLVPLPYHVDGSRHFDRLRALPGAVLLDSARAHGAQGRFDLVSALPVCTLRTQGAVTRIEVGSWLYNMKDYDKVMQVIQQSPLIDMLISHIMPMSQIQNAFELLASGKSAKVVVNPCE